MGKEEKVSRRDWVKAAAAGVVGVAVGAAAGYGLIPPKEVTVPGPTVTQTQTLTQTQVQTQVQTTTVAPTLPAGTPTDVAIAKFDSLTRDAFEAATRQIVDLLGGMTKLESVVKGKKVNIKPNIVHPHRLEAVPGKEPWEPPWPTEGWSFGVTHPHFIRALCKIINQAGAKETIFAESSAAGYQPFNNEVSGTKADLADLAFVKTAIWDDEKQVELDVPNYDALPKWAQAESLKDAVIVQAPILKGHGSSRISTIIKNNIGIQPSSWCGSMWKGPESVAAFNALTLTQKLQYESTFDTAVGKLGARFVVKTRSHGYAHEGFLKKQGRIPGGAAGTSPQFSEHYEAQIVDLAIVSGQGAGKGLYICDAHGGSEPTNCFNYMASTPGIKGTTGGQRGGVGWFADTSEGIAGQRVDVKARTGSFLLIGSYDPVAADLGVARVMGYANEELKMTALGLTPTLLTFYYANKRKLGNANPDSIVWKGVEKDNIPNAHYLRPKFPKTYSKGDLDSHTAWPCAVLPHLKA